MSQLQVTMTYLGSQRIRQYSFSGYGMGVTEATVVASCRPKGQCRLNTYLL